MKQPVTLFQEVTGASLFSAQNYFPLLIPLFCKKLSQYFTQKGREGEDDLPHPKIKLCPSHYINSKAFHPKLIYLTINKTAMIKTVPMSH